MSRHERGYGRSRQVHWQVPTLMTGALILGVGSAVAHHLFYQYRDTKRASSESEQTWSIRIGTGLAFLVQISLVAATGTAYVQHFWWLLRRNDIRISTIDSMFSMLQNPFLVFDSHVWSSGPGIVLLAAIALALPLTTIVTPATLTVRLANNQFFEFQRLPIQGVNWTSQDMAVYEGVGRYEQPSPDLKRIAFAVGTGASILNIPAPAPNASYNLNHYAPAITCSSSPNTTTTKSGKTYVYNSQKLYTNESTRFIVSTGQVDTTCEVYNASYTSQFRFENGVQTISIQNFTTVAPYNRLNYSSAIALPSERPPINYAAVLDAFGGILYGNVSVGSTTSLFALDTQVLLTSLVYATDFYPALISESVPVAPKQANVKNFTMAQGLEEFFFNLTTSLLSQSRYLNSRIETTPISVEVFSPQTVYVYNSKVLWLSYGLAIVFASLSTLVGLSTIFGTGLSYSNSFSTILRVSRNPELIEAAGAEEHEGAEPLPKNVAGVKLVLEGSLYRSEPKFQDIIVSERPKG